MFLGLAVCAAASIGSAFYSIHRENTSLRKQTLALQRELRFLPRPSEARPLLRAAVRRGESRTVPAPLAGQPLAIDLAIGEALFMRYRAVLETVDGRVVWVSGNLRPQGRIVAAEIPAGAIRAKEYRLRLAGSSSAGDEPVAEFGFRLQPSE